MDSPEKPPTIETFIEAANNEINKEIAHMKPPKYSNLSKGEQKALEDLQERDDIVIVNADKAGAVVIMDASDYKEKAERQITRSITANFQKIKLQQRMK